MLADQPDAFFSRDVVNPVDDCCFQVIDCLRLSQEHPIFQVAPKIEVQGVKDQVNGGPTPTQTSDWSPCHQKWVLSQPSDSPAVWGGAPSCWNRCASLLSPLCIPRDPQSFSGTSMYRSVFTERALPESSLNHNGPMMPCVLIATHAVHVSHRVERPLQDHVGRLASPVDIVLPVDIPRELDLCFIRKPNVSQNVRHISDHVSDPFTDFHSLLHMSFCQLLFPLVSVGVKLQVISQYCSEGLPGNVLAPSPHWLLNSNNVFRTSCNQSKTGRLLKRTL